MLGAPYIEDFCVLSTVHDYPLRVVQLESYINRFINLISETIDQIDDERTVEFLQRSSYNASKSYENIGERFFNEAKIKLGFPTGVLFWPKDFPTIRILNCERPTVKIFTKKDLTFLKQKKKEIKKTLRGLCDVYNPILLIAIPTIQMENVTIPKNSETQALFESAWASKELPVVEIEKIVKSIIENGLDNLEVKIMDESLRQIVLTESDLQRELRKRLYEQCSQGQGTETLFSEYILLQLIECLYTDISIDMIIGGITGYDMPIIILEDNFLSLHVPIISEQDTLPFQKELDERQKRYLHQFISSKAIDETSIPALYFLNKSLSKDEGELLSFLSYQIEKARFKMVVFPLEKANELYAKPLKIEEEVVDEWINGEKSPFIKVLWKGTEYCLATRNIIEDKIFRIAWRTNKATHVKLRGNKFEDFILEALKEVFPKSFQYKNKYFTGEYQGKRKKLEIDRIFAQNGLFFILECKNLSIIEDTTKIKKLKSREQELKAYGNYLEIKANQLAQNFKQIENSVPGLREFNCEKIAPVILSLYPDIFSFYKVPFMTIYEFIRYVSECQQKDEWSKTFEDLTGVTFEMRFYDIVR